MNMVSKIKKLHTYQILLFLSLFLFLLKGLEYAFLGLPYPLGICLVLLSPFLLGFVKQGKPLRAVLKYWGILVLAYGFYRIVLQIFVHAHGDGVPSAAYYQFTVWYGLMSIFYVVAGRYLMVKRKYFSLRSGVETKEMDP